MLVVDTRWEGNHGIARFAREVVGRLGLDFHRLSERGSPTALSDPLLGARLRLGASDVLFSPGFNCGISRARQIVCVHDLIHLLVEGEASRSKALYYNAIVRPTIRRSRLVLTVSETSKAWIADWLADPNVRIENVGNGCSELFGPNGPRDSSAQPKFLFVGSAKPHKNVVVFLKALAERPQYRGVVVCPDVGEIAQLAVRVGVQHQVDFKTGLSDEELARLYRSASALVMPSTIEGFGLPALEALKCGTPVAYYSGCSAVAEIVQDCGVSVASAEDAGEWALSMDRMLLNSETDWVSESARQRLNFFSWEGVGSRVNEVLSDAVGAR